MHLTAPGRITAHSRHVLPSFVERTSYGVQESNPYKKLFEGRIIFLGTEIDDAAANDVMAQLVCLGSTEPDRAISMYINSPGGSLTAMTAIYDTMQYIRPEVYTFCLGQAASAAAVILAAGSPGRRSVVPSSRVLIHQPAVGTVQGQVSDLEIQAAELSRLRRVLESTLAVHTGQTEARIRADIDRDLILTAEQAVAYGLADHVVVSRKSGQ
jgi:ATP-dependent Clp protease protease subunit